MRSVISRPASLRMPWIVRMRSRTTPSSRSSGVISVSSATTKPSPSVTANPSRARVRSSNSPGLSELLRRGGEPDRLHAELGCDDLDQLADLRAPDGIVRGDDHLGERLAQAEAGGGPGGAAELHHPGGVLHR